MNVAVGNDDSRLHHAPRLGGGFGNLLIEMLVQELRGRLTWFDPDPGTGAEIVMPMDPGSQGGAILSRDKSLRILIVEDEILIALELESLLQDAGHDVVGIAASSVEALDQGKTLKPDIAFVDIHLADGPTGVDVARQLVSQHNVTVLFMTANAKRIPEDFAGARGVIAKPYTERGVMEALAYVMAEQGHEPDDTQTMTFIPFGRRGREDSSQLS